MLYIYKINKVIFSNHFTLSHAVEVRHSTLFHLFLAYLVILRATCYGLLSLVETIFDYGIYPSLHTIPLNIMIWNLKSIHFSSKCCFV